MNVAHATVLGALTGMGQGDGGGMSGRMWMPTLYPTPARLMGVHLQPVPVLPALALLLLAGYLLGLVVLRRRGLRWSGVRTLCWVLGIAVIVAMTATGVDGYGMRLFSVHMVQHMLLSMLAPALLVLGHPVSLLLHVLPTTARRALLAALDGPVARAVTHPVVTIPLFLFSLYGIYFTPVFDDLMSTMAGHNLMLLGFLATGGLYYWTLLRIDASPWRRGHAVGGLSPLVTQILELFITLPVHAFFGVVVMMSSTLIVHFYATPVAGWGIAPLSDEYTAGEIAWALSEPLMLVLLAALLIQWQRSEKRVEVAQLRRPVQADAELRSYNDYLRSLAARDTAPHGGGTR